MTRVAFTDVIPAGFTWLNPPTSILYQPDDSDATGTPKDGGFIEFATDPETDFWQRSHYGFRRDNGHCLLRQADGEFSFAARFEFESVNQYDQCGIFIRHDAENWIKASIERENSDIGRLGSVATNLGFSDWATTDIPATVAAMSYRASRKKDDILLENSADGLTWNQMRITHLHAGPPALAVGIYAASPTRGSFTCRVVEMAFGANEFFRDE